MLAIVLAGPPLAQAQDADTSAAANTAASAIVPAAILVPADVRYCNQRSILIRYRWTGTAPKGVQMWISLDGTQWLPWQWTDKPAEPFAFSPPRQGRILLALAPAECETAAVPCSGYQSLVMIFDWDKPLVRLISSEVHATPPRHPPHNPGSHGQLTAQPDPQLSQPALRLAWAAWDENLGDRPISLHWRHSPDEPWQQAVGDLPNSGAYDWTLPDQLAGKTFNLCLRATDLAGNPAEVICLVSAKSAPPESPPAAAPAAAASQPVPASRPANPAMPTPAAAEAERLCQMAEQHVNQNELDMAGEMFRQAAATDPTYYAARLNLGVLLQRRGRHAEAIAEYEAVLAIKPDNVTAWRNLALAYMTIRDYPKARITLQKLLAVDPDNPQVWIDLGDVEMLMGRTTTAKQYWEKASALSKPNTESATRAAKRLSVYVKEK
jgi:tetratricopeptide (TPR) repeat protein